MPPVETAADRASFFDATEFGNVGEVRGEPIEGLFDEPSEFLDGLAPVGIGSTNPTFLCQTTDLPTDLEEGEPITITRADDSEFEGEVATVEPDGQGMTLLGLRSDG